jgi:cell shape-determining protein MreC
MTQFQFDVLCKVIENGAPALANELCSAVSTLVQSYNKLAEENERLKAELEESKAE